MSEKTNNYFVAEFFPSNIGGNVGTTDYEQLSNKPKINGFELIGNKSDKDLGIEAVEVAELALLLS